MSTSLFARLNRRFGPRQDALTRRELLRASAAAGAALLLSGPHGRVLAGLGRSGGKRVVVIGGGFAGLASAHELRSAGYDVTVVEARNRVGGRVLSFSDFVAGRNIEGGGELIGSNHPTWVAYAEKFKLEFLDVNMEEDLESPVFLDGRMLTAEESEQAWKELDAAHAAINPEAEKVNAEMPWESDNAKELDARSVADWVKGAKLPDLARKVFLTETAANNGVTCDKQSLLAMLTAIKGGGVEKYWTDTEVYRCKGGNQQLATKLAEGIGADRIVLKLPVTDVDARGGTLRVKCADGRELEADDVIVTVPPSVWNRIKFNPELPKPLTTMQMGVNVKYLAVVKDRFWHAKKLSQYYMSDTPLSMTWDGTDGQGDGKEACLTGFSGGPAAEQCRAFPKDKRDERYRAEYEKPYPEFGANFVKARFMDWPSDEWTMAGYSFPAPGQITRIGPMLHKGLGKLHFAGEHTCYRFVGYMEGGLNSGVALARRIAQRDGVAGA